MLCRIDKYTFLYTFASCKYWIKLNTGLKETAEHYSSIQNCSVFFLITPPILLYANQEKYFNINIIIRFLQWHQLHLYWTCYYVWDSLRDLSVNAINSKFKSSDRVYTLSQQLSDFKSLKPPKKCVSVSLFINCLLRILIEYKFSLFSTFKIFGFSKFVFWFILKY